MFLTKTELEAMTGLMRPKAQARWLTRYRIQFWIRSDGHLSVPRSAVEVKQGKEKHAQPDWDAINAKKTA